MKIKNAQGNIVVIALMTLLCLAVLAYGGYATYYGIFLFKQGSLKFIMGLFLIVCIGLPSIYWVLSTAYNYFASVPLLIYSKNIKIINPYLIQEPYLYSNQEKLLCTVVQKLSLQAKLPKPPQIGIELNSVNANAYALGPTRSYSLIVVTSCLASQLNIDQTAAVIGHELGHIANMDTMAKTLLYTAKQGIELILFFPLNFVVKRVGVYIALLSFIIGIIHGLTGKWQYAIASFLIVVIWLILSVLPRVITFIFNLLSYAHSRWREYHADAVGAKLTSIDAMASALAVIERLPFTPPKGEQQKMRTLWIRGPMQQRNGLFYWLKDTHPPIDKRIEALRRKLYIH